MGRFSIQDLMSCFEASSSISLIIEGEPIAEPPMCTFWHAKSVSGVVGGSAQLTPMMNGKAGRSRATGFSGAPTKMRLPPGRSSERYPISGIDVSLVVEMIKSRERRYGAKSSSLPEWVAMKRVAPICSRTLSVCLECGKENGGLAFSASAFLLSLCEMAVTFAPRALAKRRPKCLHATQCLSTGMSSSEMRYAPKSANADDTNVLGRLSSAVLDERRVDGHASAEHGGSDGVVETVGDLDDEVAGGAVVVGVAAVRLGALAGSLAVVLAVVGATVRVERESGRAGARRKRRWRAGRGKGGRGRARSGQSPESRIIRLIFCVVCGVGRTRPGRCRSTAHG